MSNGSIDENVVALRFDNKQFEQGASESISTLEKLKASLNFKGHEKAFADIDKAANKVSFNGLMSGADNVVAKFSYMQMTIQHQLDQIVDKAVTTGKNIAKALTIDPIKTGLDEYGIKMNAIQVIKANTNDSMDTITDSLDELNTYADKTIYNFAQMTSNVGKFVAQGLDIKKATKAIQGLANLAGASGASAQDMARATYQMSQALGGTIRKIDWNSLRNANMATTKLKETIIAVAENHGIAIKKMIKEEGNFEETLQKGWLTGDLFTEAMNMYSNTYTKAQLKAKGYSKEQIKMFKDLAKTAEEATTEVKTLQQLWDVLKETAQSGWTQSWEYIIGDFETAKKDLSELQRYMSDILNKQADERNKVLEIWNEKGGRASAIEAIKNTWQGLLSVITPIKEAFREIFPKKTGKELIEITQSIEKFTKKLILSEDAQKQLKDTAKGFFSLIGIGTSTIKEIISAIGTVIKSLTGLGGGILDITGTVGRALTKLGEYAKEHNIVAESAQKAATAISEFIEATKVKMDVFKFHKLAGFLKDVWHYIAPLGKKAQKVAGEITVAFGRALGNGGLSSLLDIINTGLLGSVLVTMQKFLKSAKGTADSFGGILKNIKGILSNTKDALEAWQKTLRARTLLTIAKSIAILAASLFLLATMDPKALNQATGAITMLFAELAAAMALMSKLQKGSGKKGLFDLTVVRTMIGFAASVALLAIALKSVGKMDWDEIAKGLTGIGGCMALLIATVKILDKGDIKKSMKGSSKLVVFAVAINLMANALKSMADLDWDDILRGIVAMSGVMAEMLIFETIITKIKPKKILTASSALVLVGASMEIFANVIKKFEGVSWETLGKAAAGMGGILLIAATFGKLSSYSKKLLKSATALAIIGGAMEIMVDVVGKLGKIDPSVLITGEAAMAGVLAMTALFSLLAGQSKHMAKSAVALTIIAGAMEILTDVVAKIGSMDWKSLGRAGAGIGGLTAIITAFSILNSKFGNLGKAAASLLVMSVAIKGLSTSLVKMGNMKVAQIAKALVVLAGAFTIIGVGSVALSSTVPAILAVSGAIAVLGGALLIFGGGVTLAATGFALLATSAATGAVALVAAFTTITMGIVSLSGELTKLVTDTIVAVITGLAKAIPTIVNALITMIQEIIHGLATEGPKIAKDLLAFTLNLLEQFAKNTPKIVDNLLTIVIGFIEGLGKRMPEIVHAVANLFTQFFKAVAGEFKSMSGDGLLEILEGIALITGITIALGALASFIPSAMVGVVGLGAIMAELALVLAAVGALSKIPGLKWLINGGGDLLMHIGKAIGKFVGGIVGGLAEGIMDSAPAIAKDLSKFMKNLKPFLDGAKDIDPNITSSVGSLCKAILAITGTEIIKHLTSWLTGDNSIDEFGKDLVKFGKYFKQFSDEVIDIDPVIVTAAATAASALAAMAKNAPKKGGLVSLFKGDNSLDKFGKQLPAFAKHIVKFSKSLKGLDVANIDTATKAMKAITGMAKSVPNSGGLISLFKGDNDIGKFGKALVSFGKDMASFSEYGAKINIDGVNNASKAFKTLANKGVKSLTTSFKKAGPQVTMATEVLINHIISTLKSKQSECNKYMRQFVAGMTSELSKANMKKAGAKSMNSFIAGYKGNSKYAYDATAKVMKTLCKKIESYKQEVNKAGKNIAKALKEGIISQNGAIKKAGGQAVDGYVKGLSSKNDAVKKAARLLGKNTVDALRKELDIHSPSRKTKAQGQFAVEGYIEPLDDAAPRAYEVGAALGAATLMGMKDSLTGVASVTSAIGNIGSAASAVTGTVKDSTDMVKSLKDVGTSLVYTRKQLMGFVQDLEVGKYVAREMIDLYGRNDMGEVFRGAAYEANQAKEAIYGYALALYKASDQYKQDKSQIKQDQKAYEQAFKDRAKIIRDNEKEKSKINKDSYKEEEKIQKKIEKLKKENAKKNAQQIKSLEKQIKDIQKKRKENLKESDKNLKQNLKSADKNIEQARKKLENDEKMVRKNIINGFKDMRNSIKENLAQLTNVLNTPFSGFALNLQDFKNTTVSTIGQIADGMSGLFDEFKYNGEDSTDSVSNGVSGVTETVRELGDGIKEIITRSKTAADNVTSVIGTALKKVDVLGNLKNYVDADRAFDDILGELTKAGLEPRVIKEIRDMGAAQGQVYAESFKAMSSADIEQYNKLWNERNERLLAQQKAANEISKQQLIKGLEDSIRADETFDLYLAQLRNRGLDTKVISEIRALGVEQGTEYAKAFMDMSGQELQDYGQKWIEKNQKVNKETYLQNIRDNIAIVTEYSKKLASLSDSSRLAEGFKAIPQKLAESLATMGSDAYSYIDMYLSMSEKEWNEFIKLYQKSEKVPGTAANTIMGFVVESFKNDGGEGAKVLSNDLSETIKNALATVYVDAGTQATKQTKKQIKKQATRACEETVTTMANTIESNDSKKKVKDASKALANESYKGMNTYIGTSKGRQLATYMCNGLISGFVSGRSGVINAAVSTAVAAYQAARDALDINSPSKKFESLGMYSDIGLAKGMTNFAYLVQNSAKEVGNTALDTVKSAIETIGDTIDSDINLNPVITPMLDLSRIGKDILNLDTMTSKTLAMSIEADRTHTNNAVNATEEKKSEPTSNQYIFNQNNYSPKALSHLEIYRQTRNQFAMLKGVVESK